MASFDDDNFRNRNNGHHTRCRNFEGEVKLVQNHGREIRKHNCRQIRCSPEIVWHNFCIPDLNTSLFGCINQQLPRLREIRPRHVPCLNQRAKSFRSHRVAKLLNILSPEFCQRSQATHRAGRTNQHILVSERHAGFRLCSRQRFHNRLRRDVLCCHVNQGRRVDSTIQTNRNAGVALKVRDHAAQALP